MSYVYPIVEYHYVHGMSHIFTVAASLESALTWLKENNYEIYKEDLKDPIENIYSHKEGGMSFSVMIHQINFLE